MIYIVNITMTVKSVGVYKQKMVCFSCILYSKYNTKLNLHNLSILVVATLKTRTKCNTPLKTKLSKLFWSYSTICLSNALGSQFCIEISWNWDSNKWYSDFFLNPPLPFPPPLPKDWNISWYYCIYIH